MKMVCTGCGARCSEYSAGTVNTAPATVDADAAPIPVMIMFSSRLERRRNSRAIPIARIEMGIAASIPCPTFSAE